MSEWISVEDQHPAHNVCVDIFCDGPDGYHGRVENVFYDRERGAWWNHEFKDNVDKLFITHWMPLPDLPKGE